jgi:hypothetical protein
VANHIWFITKQGEVLFAKSVDLLYIFPPQGSEDPVRMLVEVLVREGCASCARAKAEGRVCVGLCVSARLYG